MSFDVFLSYASADRTAVVEPLLNKLHERGVRSWCDIHEIRWGDSIIQKIQEGLAESKFVIAFLSPAYVSRDWTMKELRTAMAQQVSGRTTVLPVLMGISARDLEKTFPFLSEIRHLTIYEYKQTEPVAEHQIEMLVQELERAQSALKPIGVVESFEVMKLHDEIKSVSFNRHYRFYAVLTENEYAETNLLYLEEKIKVERSEVRRSLSRYIERNKLSESNPFHLCFLDIDRSPAPIYVLPSGNLIVPHRGSALSGEIKAGDYVKTGAPPNPCCVTEGSRGEVFLGYPDGLIYGWNRERVLSLLGHSARVSALDTSTESILASGDYNGNVAIWSRQDGSLRKLFSVGRAPIASISVSRSAGAALIAVGDDAGSLGLYTFDGQFEVQLPIEQKGSGLIRFIPGAVPLLAFARGDSVQIWHYAKAQLVTTLRDHDALITALYATGGTDYGFGFFDRARSPERIAVVTAGFNDGHVHQWELRT